MRPDMDRFVVPVLAIWLCVAAGIESADAASRQESAVLPAAINGWILDGQEAHYDARTVFDYIDGAASCFSPTASSSLPCAGSRRQTSRR